MIYQHSRFQIWAANQHPYKHHASEFTYANPSLPTGTPFNVETALNWIFANLYPQTKPAVATVAALPAVGNTLNDYRVVQDDGDGKAASYRWEQREGEASASWHKVYDMDWGVDSILAAFQSRSDDRYVHKYGYDDLDSAGTVVAGTYAGQTIFGGWTAGSNLTLFANAGDGVGATTGFIQFGDNARPTADSAFSLGTTGVRWLKLWTDEVTSGTMTITGGSITDTSGLIDFADEDLATDGSIIAGNTLLLDSGSITDTTGTIDFDDENLFTDGGVTANNVQALGSLSAFTTGTTIGTLVFADGSITDPGGTIDFDDEHLTTSGNIGGNDLNANGNVSALAGYVQGGNLRLTGNTLSSEDVNGDINLNPNGTGDVLIAAGAVFYTFDQSVTGDVDIIGSLSVDNLDFNGSTISSTNLNGDILLDPNGTGIVEFYSAVRPDTDNAYDLGDATHRWQDIFMSGTISDGTTSVPQATIQSLRDINVGVASGHTIFWNGTKWVSSLPDTEVDHGTISGLGDDDHTQYALLAGRAGGQTLNGNTASGGDLTLHSTSHATKGSILWYGALSPGTDLTYNLGAVALRVNDAYIGGQLIGARVQNATTAGRPAASAGTIGRMVYDTDLADVFVDRGGTWKKLSLEKYVLQDTTGWTGTETSAVYTVSSEVSDARECVWVFKSNSLAFEQLAVQITMTQTQVTVTVGIPLPAGTYTLVGVG